MRQIFHSAFDHILFERNGAGYYTSHLIIIKYKHRIKHNNLINFSTLFYNLSD